MATSLTLERIFGAPDLNGSPPQQIRFRPDGGALTFLRARQDDVRTLDLYGCDLATGKVQPLLRAGSSDTSSLSREERDRRERLRIFSAGIVEYQWFPDSMRLLIPMQGDLCVYSLRDGCTTTLETAGVQGIAPRISATGDWLAYVGAGDLWVLDCRNPGTAARNLTQEAQQGLSFGLAEFIAQEEMGRHEGFWWSPQGDCLAFVRVDERHMPLTHRLVFEADETRIEEQRYPFAGGANARVELGIVSPFTGALRMLPRCWGSEDYLARVNWFPDGRRLAIQIQNRAQDRLTLIEQDVHTGDTREILVETSPTWVNLHDNLRFLGAGEEFLWTSERSGPMRLSRMSIDGRVLALLTPEAGMINRILHADADRSFCLVTGWLDTPLENHLYRVDMRSDQAVPQRLTPVGGWHEVAVSPNGRSFVRLSSSRIQPPELFLHRGNNFSGQPIGTPEPHPFSVFRNSFSPPRFGVLEADDGQPLHYRLTLPSDFDEGRSYPALVHVYGGPGVQCVRDEWPRLIEQYLAGCGHVILQLDNRGGSNRGQVFEAPIHHNLGGPEVADQAVAARFLAAQPYVDARRIGIYGHSYGGYMTLMCMCKEPDLFRAGVAIAPVIDWRLYDTHYTERYLGPPDRCAHVYEQSSVMAHLRGLRGRLLVIHGMADDNVLFAGSVKLFAELQNLGIAFEMMTYPGSKHGLAEIPVAMHRFRLLEDFFRRTLDG